MEQHWNEHITAYSAPIGDYNVLVEYTEALHAWVWEASSINELRSDASSMALKRGVNKSGRFGMPEDAKSDVLAWLNDEAKKEFD